MVLTHDDPPRRIFVMVHAHDGGGHDPWSTARAGDGSFLFLSRPALNFAFTGGIGGYESLHSLIDIQSWVRAACQISVDVLPADWEPAPALRAAIWQLYVRRWRAPVCRPVQPR